jgi:hypothetical protein
MTAITSSSASRHCQTRKYLSGEEFGRQIGVFLDGKGDSMHIFTPSFVTISSVPMSLLELCAFRVGVHGSEELYVGAVR